MTRKFLYSAFCLFVVFITNAQEPSRIRTLIIIFDGLRPDYITMNGMPNLFALKDRGCYATEHHSVFPTVTRVNASSYVTGAYPKTHGLLGNTVYFPEVDKEKGLNTGDFHELQRIADATEGKLLTVSSLGELLHMAGERMMVFSSGSSGQAFLQNHTISGGGVINPEVILPSELKEDVIKTIGTPPPGSKPNRAQHEWATRALIQYGLAADGPLVNAIWFSDPDGTAHTYGIGSPLATESLKEVDLQLGNILKALEERGLSSSFNIIITADHGFVTAAGTQNLGAFVKEIGVTKGPGSDDVVLAGNAIYVKGHDPALIKKIVSQLQEQPWVGAIFTGAKEGQSVEGWVGGTLSFESIHWNHSARAADILVDYNWDDERNSFGYEGRSLAPGVAGHGGSSPYEIHIPLIGYGPQFKNGFESSLPTSNIDIAPTILHMHHLPVPSTMDGRVLKEILAENAGKESASVKKQVTETFVNSAWGSYRLILERSVVAGRYYVNFTRVERKLKGRKK